MKPSIALASVLMLASLGLAACTVTQASSKRKKGEVYQDETDNTLVGEPATPVVEDGGIFDIGAKPNTSDAGSRQSTTDGGKVTACSGDLKPGDLVVVEVMVSSRAGSGDPGEWVELMNTRNCRIDVEGVTIVSPRGTTDNDSVTVGESIELDPFETFVVAGSTDVAQNNGLPGKVLAWAKTDVLKNSGDTIRVTLGKTVLDEFVYPEFKSLPVGTSFTFPDGCKLADRYVAGNPGVWTKKWSLSLGTWKAGFKGTPNAPNIDVACPSP